VDDGELEEGRHPQVGLQEVVHAREAKTACSRVHQGPHSSAPRSKVRAGLGRYYAGKYTHAESEGREGPDRW
jgi:hypothetical protein